MKLMRKLLRLFPAFGGVALSLILPASAVYAAGPLTPDQCRHDHGVPVSGVLGPALGVADNCLGNSGQNPIFELVGIFINFFSMIFGLILVGMIVYAGFLYITSDGSPEATKEAKDRLKGAITGLVLFSLMFAILQYIMPGDQRIFQ
jgi:hypothetical protein